MIKLNVPLLWEGHTVPAGTVCALAPGMERLLLSAKNAEPVENEEVPSAPPEAEPQNANQPTPQEKDPQNSDSQASSATQAPVDDDPEVHLGRTGTPK